jgi:hypothetical protein
VRDQRKYVVRTNGYVHRGSLLLLPTEPPSDFEHGDLIALLPDWKMDRVIEVIRRFSMDGSEMAKEASRVLAVLGNKAVL